MLINSFTMHSSIITFWSISDYVHLFLTSQNSSLIFPFSPQDEKMNVEALSRAELLTLLSILEGELEAQDVVIHALRVSYIKHLKA